MGAGEGDGAETGRAAAAGAMGAEAVAGNGDAEGACATGGAATSLAGASEEWPLMMPSMFAELDSSLGASAV